MPVRFRGRAGASGAAVPACSPSRSLWGWPLIQCLRTAAAAWTGVMRASYSFGHARAARREEAGRPLRPIPGPRALYGLRRLTRHRGAGAGAPGRLVDEPGEPHPTAALLEVGGPGRPARVPPRPATPPGVRRQSALTTRPNAGAAGLELQVCSREANPPRAGWPRRGTTPAVPSHRSSSRAGWRSPRRRARRTARAPPSCTGRAACCPPAARPACLAE
jgi:hypothetical protein